MSERERSWLAIRDAEVAYAEDASNTDLYFAYRKGKRLSRRAEEKS
jgi:hypothetical protein